jgi:biotin carboxyl carrier protein
MKVEIVISEYEMKKIGAYACKCQKTEIDMKWKKAKVFWVAELMDKVEQGEVLCELEVQKTIVEIRSPCCGRLADICIADNDDCTFGSILGYIET